MKLIDTFINDKKRILDRFFNYKYEINYREPISCVLQEHNEVLPGYKKWADDCALVRDKPDRHKIVQSDDINSCFRYMSFNEKNINELNITFHFRSQNQLTKLWDEEWALSCINTFLNGKIYKYINITVYIDEFIIVKLI